VVDSNGKGLRETVVASVRIGTKPKLVPALMERRDDRVDGDFLALRPGFHDVADPAAVTAVLETLAIGLRLASHHVAGDREGARPGV
jgi:hypothetical protein